MNPNAEILFYHAMPYNERQVTTPSKLSLVSQSGTYSRVRVLAFPSAVLIKPQATDIISSDLLISSSLFSYL